LANQVMASDAKLAKLSVEDKDLPKMRRRLRDAKEENTRLQTQLSKESREEVL
jgi:hypothetical protein